MESTTILGVKISKVDYSSAMEEIERFLSDGQKHYVVTPNPEFVVLAQSDEKFHQILNRADLAVPDGVGLGVGSRVTGTDLMIKLCSLASKKGYSVFLLGGRGGVAEKAAERLKAQFADLNIVGTCEADPEEALSVFRAALSAPRPTPVSTRGDVNSLAESDSPSPLSVSADTISLDSKSSFTSASTIVSPGVGLRAVDFLFVAYGAPKQEKWIAKNLDKIPVRVAMGVGGAFDFIAGKKRRAPLALRQAGLEWLWRLIKEPQRLPRIFNAVVKFPLLVLLHRFKTFRLARSPLDAARGDLERSRKVKVDGF